MRFGWAEGLRPGSAREGREGSESPSGARTNVWLACRVGEVRRDKEGGPQARCHAPWPNGERACAGPCATSAGAGCQPASGCTQPWPQVATTFLWRRKEQDWTDRTRQEREPCDDILMLTSLQGTATFLKLSEHRQCFLKTNM